MRNSLASLLIVAASLSAVSCDEQTPADNAMPEESLVSTATAPPVESRDMTSGETWIQRLERPDRVAGLRIDAVIEALGLKDGDVVADIGAGPGVFSIAFAKAVAPSGRVIAADIWPELMDYIDARASDEGLTNVDTLLCDPDDPKLPPGLVDIAFFHDVFHNVPDRQDYLELLASYLRPDGRIAIIEQEFDDPIAKVWDVPEDRITQQQVDDWMSHIGFQLLDEFDLFQGDNNPPDARMPERWFVVYARSDAD
ncbi:MAG: methyltransferase domain-containing protein [Gammaproteobacteria bacterium]|nr:methyltransferase domain-containing protein [Gammaproteobacteria bacterium]